MQSTPTRRRLVRKLSNHIVCCRSNPMIPSSRGSARFSAGIAGREIDSVGPFDDGPVHCGAAATLSGGVPVPVMTPLSFCEYKSVLYPGSCSKNSQTQ